MDIDQLKNIIDEVASPERLPVERRGSAFIITFRNGYSLEYAVRDYRLWATLSYNGRVVPLTAVVGLNSHAVAKAAMQDIAAFTPWYPVEFGEQVSRLPAVNPDSVRGRALANLSSLVEGLKFMGYKVELAADANETIFTIKRKCTITFRQLAAIHGGTEWRIEKYGSDSAAGERRDAEGWSSWTPSSFMNSQLPDWSRYQVGDTINFNDLKFIVRRLPL